MLMGEFSHTVDEKGRLIVPARFREELGERFVVTKGLDKCLFVYSMAEWQRIELKLRELPFTKADVRAFVRLFIAPAAECELDKQGRILLPPNLRQYAGLSRDVVVIGALSRVEIWDRDEWATFSEKAEGAYAEIAEKIIDF